MPRRNNRAEYVPLDLTPPEVEARQWPPTGHGKPRHQTEFEAAERQKRARINEGIDWSVCLVPGCGERLMTYGILEHARRDKRDALYALPICHTHAVVVWQEIQRRKREPLIMETNEILLQRTRDKFQAEDEAAKKRRLASTDGKIYFVRLNGLIKVGWSRDVDERLRAYGPEIEVLCIYPGSRDDETYLHRQLRPVLARGREWYQDHPIVTDYVAKIIEKYGEPHYADWWTKPKETIRPRKRGR